MMAQPVQMTFNNKKIFFDDGTAYVMCNFNNPSKTKFCSDQLGRSPFEREFLEKYIRIFTAAASGDLATCKSIVQEGKFSDINASCVGQFEDQTTHEPLNMSPMSVAQRYEQHEICAFFLDRFGKAPQDTTVEMKNPFTEKEQKLYHSHKKQFNALIEKKEAPELFLHRIQMTIISTYLSEERTKARSTIVNLDFDGLIRFIKTRCEEIASELPKNIELLALRDSMQELSSTLKAPKAAPEQMPSSERFSVYKLSFDKKTLANLYNAYKKSYKELIQASDEILLRTIRLRIVNVFSLKDRLGEFPDLAKMSSPDLVEYFKQVCDQTVASDPPVVGLGIIELFALWNSLVETSSFPRILAIEIEQIQ